MKQSLLKHDSYLSSRDMQFFQTVLLKNHSKNHSDWCWSSALRLWNTLNHSCHLHGGREGLCHHLWLLQDLWHRESLRCLNMSQVRVRVHHHVTRVDHNTHDASRAEAWVGGFLVADGLGDVTCLRWDQRDFRSFIFCRISIQLLHYNVPQFSLPGVVVLSALVDFNVSSQVGLEEKVSRGVRVGTWKKVRLR